jgi:hypothetical protein
MIMMPEKLKIGILLDSEVVPAWAFSVLEKIRHSDYAEITLVVANGSFSSSRKQSYFGRACKNWQKFLYKIYIELENRLFKHRPDAFEAKDLSELLKNVPQISVMPRQTAYTDYFESSDVQAIRQHDVDVLVRLGFRILRGEVLNAARFGIWSYHHSDNKEIRGWPPGFWEKLEGKPVIGTVLQILSEDLDNGLVLYRSYTATQQLLSRSLHQCFWKSASFLPRALKELHTLGEKRFFDQVREANQAPLFYSSKFYTAPTNLQVIKFIWIQFAGFVKHILVRALFLEQWVLWFRFQEGLALTFAQYKKIVPPKGLFWADPFVVFKEGQYYIFLEEFEYSRKKGRIAVMPIDEHGNRGKVVSVLDLPYHLSYPFVFQFEGDYYMMPESQQNRTVDLYKCVQFPHKWEFQKSLLKGVDAVDATLFSHGGKWWLFANVIENKGGSDWDELFLYYADSPLSDIWTSHPCNPVVSDVRRARPAGKIFSHNGAIFRPSQDCSVRYGYGLNINCIEVLNEREYRERLVSYAKPEWSKSVSAVHTLNHENRLTVIDSISYRPKASWYMLFIGLVALIVKLLSLPPIPNDLMSLDDDVSRVVFRVSIVVSCLCLIALLKFRRPSGT